MYLSVYLSRAGVCSRRQAAELIKKGLVRVNNNVVHDPAHQVSEYDQVFFQNHEITIPSFLYVLLNKPVGCITTMHDEKGRKTVFDYIKIEEKVFPVGRLDRDTSGLLLFTNDGVLAHQLMHPRFSIEKEYLVTLALPLDQNDFMILQKGVQLSDGFIKPDKLYIINNNRYIIGIVIHSGKNRIIRRLFAHVGYKVKGLDRIRYAMLKKGNLKLGQCRKLLDKEIDDLRKQVVEKLEKQKNTRARKNLLKVR